MENVTGKRLAFDDYQRMFGKLLIDRMIAKVGQDETQRFFALLSNFDNTVESNEMDIPENVNTPRNIRQLLQMNQDFIVENAGHPKVDLLQNLQTEMKKISKDLA